MQHRRDAASSEEIFQVGEIFHEQEGACMVIYPAEEVHPAVAHPQIRNPEGEIVARDLLKSGLAQRHGRGLAFHDKGRFSEAVIQHDIRTSAHCIQHKLLFDTYQGTGIPVIMHQKMQEVLAHPFFRCKEDVLFPDGIEYISIRSLRPCLQYITAEWNFHLLRA